MTSAKKAAANRSNARRSTGPKSVSGLARSSRYAIKNGLFARTLLLRGEDIDAYEALWFEVRAHLKPVGVIEESFAELIIGDMWRLERLKHVENASLKKTQAERARRAANGWGDDLLMPKQFCEDPDPMALHFCPGDEDEVDAKDLVKAEASLDPDETLMAAYLSETVWSNLDKVAHERRATTRELLRNIAALKALQKDRQTINAAPAIEIREAEPGRSGENAVD
jgi:hypothetical protein